MKVSDAMTTEVQLCTPEDSSKDPAEAMLALSVGLLPVTNNGRLPVLRTSVPGGASPD